MARKKSRLRFIKKTSVKIYEKKQIVINEQYK